MRNEGWGKQHQTFVLQKLVLNPTQKVGNIYCAVTYVTHILDFNLSLKMISTKSFGLY